MKYSISRRINITVIALAAILIGLWVVGLFSLVSVQAEASRQALTHSAQTTMNAVEAQIERYATAGRVLALSPALLRDDIATFEAEAARATTALGDAWVLLARPEGEQIFNTQRSVLVPNVGRSPAAMQAQRRAFQTGAPQISDVGIGMLTREYVISVNLPIIREGQPRYLLAVVFSPRVFTKLMDGLPTDWLAAVIDGNGNYAARSLNSDELIGQPAGEGWRAVMHQTGIFDFPSREGVPLIQATISSPRLGWASGVAMSRAALYAPLWKRAAISGVVAAIAVILCLAIVIGLGRRINSSLRLLERAVGNLRRQKPTVERTGEREIDSVIEAFNLTAGEISAHEQERAAHERQMRVAAREVTHRSKNLLAVTTAIAGLLSRDAPDAKTFSIRFNERLQALSRCQDLLIASNWTEATMEDVIESQLAPFTKEQFDLFGESVKIPAGSMQALCMVFHELATNAARHGALSVANGRVAVNWSIGPEEPDRTVSIVWREIGGPTVRVPGRRGFGGTVIATSCRQSLNGTIDLDFRPEGLVCSFTILLRNPTPEPAFEAGNDTFKGADRIAV